MFKAILSAMMVMVAVLTIGSSRNSDATSLNLSQFQWKNRLLLLFAPSPTHPSFDQLHKSLQVRNAGVKDRDLVVFEIFESDRSTMNNDSLDPQTARSLREEFSVSQGEFRVILIGKDGGIKLKRQSQTRLEDIFSLIDAMPMRREEMRQKSENRKSEGKK
ncbi:MAG: DUF4174 domain-containing protein [Desulfatiglandaceae bacterium]